MVAILEVFVLDKKSKPIYTSISIPYKADVERKNHNLLDDIFINFLFYSVITSYPLRMNSIIDKKDPHCFGVIFAYPGVRNQPGIGIVMLIVVSVFGLFVYLVLSLLKGYQYSPGYS